MSIATPNVTDGPDVRLGTQPTASAELLRIEDVCALLQTTKRTVYRLADSGRMPHGVKLGGMRRWRRAELMQWLADGCPPVRVAKGAR